jgi:uncharacterized membrane protein
MAQLSKRNRAQRRLEQAVQQNIQFAAGARLTVEQQVSSGPLPDPEILRRYDEVHSGLAERIVRLAETEADHRRGLENKIVTAQATDIRDGRIEARIGQACGLAIAITLIGCGTLVTLKGYPWAGMGLNGATLVSLVGVFVYGRAHKPDTKPQEEPQAKPGERSLTKPTKPTEGAGHKVPEPSAPTIRPTP